jgi:hypothetical protein
MAGFESVFSSDNQKLLGLLEEKRLMMDKMADELRDA